MNKLFTSHLTDKQLNTLFTKYKNEKVYSDYIKINENKVIKKYKIGIIVPFRIDRDYDFYDDKRYIRSEQLDYFIKHFKNFLDGQKYKIYIIEQSNDNQKFNEKIT